jgi:predicted phosphodiesterase
VTRLALISDIHGNCVALDAVLADSTRRQVDDIICLGDVAAGGPQPGEVINRLRELRCTVICGNAERWLLDGLPPGRSEVTHRLGEVVEWTRQMLAPAEREYLAALPPTLEVAIDSWRLFCCHGSPRSEIEPLLATTPDAEFDELLADTAAADGIACGHTHLQLLRPHRERLLLNPGSVGLPLGSLRAADGVALPAWAEYALVEVAGGDVAVTFRRLPIDVSALAAATAAMPQPTWASDLERRIVRWNARAAG